MERLIVCSKSNLNALYHQISLKHNSKHIRIFQKDAKNFLEFTAETISDASFFVALWLNEQLGRGEIEKILQDSFDFLTEEELSAVRQLAYIKLEEETQKLASMIQFELKNMLSISSVVNLEGFSNFCLQGYKQELFFMIDACLEEYWSQEEYKEFLSLLQYFTTLNRSEKSLYIDTNPKGQYQLFNESFQDITKQSMERMGREFIDSNVEEGTQNDILLSLLVLLAPEKIYLYGIAYIKNKNFIRTLKEIFQNKISFYEQNLDRISHQKL